MIEILTIGDELIAGRTADENARFIAQALHEAGLAVARVTTVGDGIEDISRALRDLLPGTRFVIITGGLGPTEDDRTALAAATTFGRALVLHDGALTAMEQKYTQFGRAMPAAARKQALLPGGSSIIPNPVGTACGFLIEDAAAQFMFLPGVPEEVRAMTGSFVLAHIGASCGAREVIRNRTLKVFGLWESGIHERLNGFLPESSIVTLGYYPQYPEVSIKINGRGPEQQRVQDEIERFRRIICERIGEYVYSVSDESLEEVVGSLLQARGATIAVAESCTGGLITHRLTNVPGSSAYLERAFVVYSNRAKQELLEVPEDMLLQYGAVSEPVARSMATAAREQANTTYGLAVTGIAGPAGGSAEKPVGTVFVGLASGSRTEVRQYLFPGSREKIKIMSAQVALSLLRNFILDG
jgi:nicotinamide-nucleotide amidase